MLLQERGDLHEKAYLERHRAAGRSIYEVRESRRAHARRAAGRRGRDARGDAPRDGGHLPGHVLRWPLARPRGLPPPRRATEPCSAIGATTSPTRSSPAGVKAGAILQVCVYADRLTPAPGRRSGAAGDRDRRQRRARGPADRVRGVLPHGQGALRGADLRRRRRATAGDLPRPGRPLPGVHLVPDLHGPPPGGRPPLDRGGHDAGPPPSGSSTTACRPAGRWRSCRPTGGSGT